MKSNWRRRVETDPGTTILGVIDFWGVRTMWRDEACDGGVGNSMVQLGASLAWLRATERVHNRCAATKFGDLPVSTELQDIPIAAFYIHMYIRERLHRLSLRRACTWLRGGARPLPTVGVPGERPPQIGKSERTTPRSPLAPRS